MARFSAVYAKAFGSRTHMGTCPYSEQMFADENEETRKQIAKEVNYPTEDPSWYDPWVRRLRPFLTRNQKYRERIEIRELVEKYNYAKPEIPEILEGEEGTEAAEFQRRYDRLLRSRWSYIFGDVNERKLQKFSEALEYCVESTRVLQVPDAERGSQLMEFKKDFKAQCIFSKDIMDVVVSILSSCPPARWGQPLFDKPCPATWWAKARELAGLLKALKSFIAEEEQSESALNSHSSLDERVSEGLELVLFHEKELKWRKEMLSCTKKRKVSEGACVGPGMWQVEREMHYNMPAIRLELLNIFKWGYKVSVVRKKLVARERFEQSKAFYHKAMSIVTARAGNLDIYEVVYQNARPRSRAL